ncbi:MAG: radical SAM protein [Nitrososphaerota archaeon]|jgi:uncharacterized radical SAM superfamily protein|nr:radical SAM protein [Nitrososphaerota archaeon]
MPSVTAETIWKLNQADLQALLDLGYLKPQSHTIRFYVPSFACYKTRHFCNSAEFTTISVTGNTCALNCKHCGGKVLQTMHPALSPQELFDLGMRLKMEGVRGVLVSGGCRLDGSVPLEGFVSVLGQFKRELGFSVFVHTGIIGTETAVRLKQAGVDAVLIDIIGSQRTIQKIFNLKISLKAYADSLSTLQKARLKVVPHVIVGLNDGELEGEYHAFRIIKETLNPAAVVIIAFMPLRGTDMAQTSPPQPLDIAKAIATARVMFPQTPLALGCMRPKGRHRAQTDVLALKAGVDAVAFPSEEAIEYIKKRGEYKTAFSAWCCAQMYQDF